MTAQRCPLGARLLAEFAVGDLRVTQETLLWDGAQAVQFRTHVDGSIGHDRLLRVRFPADVPGGLPVYQGATAAVGRPFGSIDADVAEHSFTLDNPAHEWFGTGSTARVSWTALSGRAEQRAIGVAEIILPGPDFLGRQPGAGRRPGGGAGRAGRHGDLLAGRTARGTAPSTWTRTCPTCGSRWAARSRTRGRPGCWRRLTRSGRSSAGRWAAGLPLWLPAAQSRAAAFAPGADVRGPRDLPVLLVAGPDLAAAVSAVAADLADSEISVTPLGDDVGAAAGRALGGAAQPGHAEQPGHPGRNAAHRADAVVQRVAVRGVDRRRQADRTGRQQLRLAALEPHVRVRAGRRARGLAVGRLRPAGQEYNHPLLVTETGVHPGRPARRSQPVPGRWARRCWPR